MIAAQTPTVADVEPIVAALYLRHCGGCCWHIVLDDGNVSPRHVEWCVSYLAQNGCRDERDGLGDECARLAEVLPLMSREQIAQLVRCEL